MVGAPSSGLRCDLQYASLLREARQSSDGDSESETETELEPESEEETYALPRPVRSRNVLSGKNRPARNLPRAVNPSINPPTLVFNSASTPASSVWSSSSFNPPPPPQSSSKLSTPPLSSSSPFNASNPFPFSPLDVPSSMEPPLLAPSTPVLKSMPPASTPSPSPVPHSAGVSSAPTIPHQLSQPSRKRAADDEDADSGSIPESVPKKQSRSNRRRCTRRKELVLADGHTNASISAVRRTVLAATQLPSEITVRGFKIAYGAYSGINSKPYGAQVRYTIERLQGKGFQLICWDGVTPVMIADREHRVFAVLAGRPGGDSYLQACAHMHEKFVELKNRIKWKKEEKKHKRGTFIALNTGIGYGKGQKHPQRFSDERQILLEELLNDPDVQRVASYQDSVMARYFPKIYAHYRQYMKRLAELLPQERRNFAASVFAAAAFNLGPNAWTWLHKDGGNYAGGQCLITSLGPFNPTRSALLILWELKMLIQFPSASTVAIPSESITHSNTPVADGDERSSFTQYTSGGIFRWLDNGGRTEQELEMEDYKEFLRLKDVRGSRWEEALRRFSTLSELINGA